MSDEMSDELFLVLRGFRQIAQWWEDHIPRWSWIEKATPVFRRVRDLFEPDEMFTAIGLAIEVDRMAAKQYRDYWALFRELDGRDRGGRMPSVEAMCIDVLNLTQEQVVWIWRQDQLYGLDFRREQRERSERRLNAAFLEASHAT